MSTPKNTAAKQGQHTKGPWTWRFYGPTDDFIRGVNLDVVTSVSHNSGNREADAARIVACVNALEGLNPEAIGEVIGALREACTVAPRVPRPATIDAWLKILQKVRAE